MSTTLAWGKPSGADILRPFTGYSTLSSTRIINPGADEGLMLDWVTHAHDANALAHIIGREGAGNADDSIDNCDVTPGSWQADGWLGAYDMHDRWSAAASIPQVNVTTGWTVEFWVYRDVTATVDAKAMFYVSGGSPAAVILIDEYVPTTGDQIRFYVCDALNHIVQTTAIGVFPAAVWHHVSLERYGDVLNAYIDGAKVVNGLSCAAIISDAAKTSFYSSAGSGSVRDYQDLYITQQALHAGAAFAPHRYEAGSAILEDAAFAGGTITDVSWSVDSGNGAVSAVYLNEGTDLAPSWTQIGGANPSSPITGLSIPVTATNIIKLTMTPLADALQSASPTLDWAMVTVNTNNLPPPLLARHRS